MVVPGHRPVPLTPPMPTACSDKLISVRYLSFAFAACHLCFITAAMQNLGYAAVADIPPCEGFGKAARLIGFDLVSSLRLSAINHGIDVAVN